MPFFVFDDLYVMTPWAQDGVPGGAAAGAAAGGAAMPGCGSG